MSSKLEQDDDYYRVSLPKSEWLHIDRWLGDNVSLTSIVLTELNKIKKTRQKGPRKSIRIGIDTIDAMIGGVCPGEVLYIGSTEEKSNLAIDLNIVQKLGIGEKAKILVFNSGRGQYAYARGIISLCTGVAESRLQISQSLSDEELEQIEETISDLHLSNVSIVSTPNICIESICEEIEKYPKTERPDLVLIDNLRFLTTRTKCKDRQQEYQMVTWKLWKLAKDVQIPVVLTGPLSKQRRKMVQYWPTARDMLTENMLENFDKIVAVHRSNKKDKENILNVTVIKNPDGTYGYREMEYDPDCNALTEMLAQNEPE